MHEDYKEISVKCIKVQQPIGSFFIASIPHDTLCAITKFDVRRILREDREIERYLGIQRPLNKGRVKEIVEYVQTVDACFPTSIILAIPGQCAQYKDEESTLTLFNHLDEESDDDKIFFGSIAQVLDGQHRIEALSNYAGERFELNVSIFIDIDIASQAYIFSTVNLAQTKVNKSLVYDLYDLAKSRSPQKLCHHIAVALDSKAGSPFYHRIRRLGVATEGRFNETITQATFVQSLLQYICDNKKQEITDRDTYMRGKVPPKADDEKSQKVIFRNMFIDEMDMEITQIIFNYFKAVENKWYNAWHNFSKGNMLNKTNGFKALMRFLRPAYLHISSIGKVPTADEFATLLNTINIDDNYFTIDNFKPGTSGESELYHTLLHDSGLA